jgi:hypothetical protein
MTHPTFRRPTTSSSGIAFALTLLRVAQGAVDSDAAERAAAYGHGPPEL